MHIAIDIRHLCSPQITGTGYYTLEILPFLVADRSISWTLFASGSARALSQLPQSIRDLPRTHPHVSIQLHREPNRLLNARLFQGSLSLDDLLATPVDLWFFPNSNFIRTSKPYVITAHDLSFDILPDCFSPKSRLWHRLVDPHTLFTHASRILAVSESTKSDLHTLYAIDSSTIDVTPLAASPLFHPDEESRDRNILRKYQITSPYFLSLSTIEPRKNHLGMIAGYTLWRSQNPQLSTPYYIVGGEGYRASRVLHAIKSSPYADSLRFIPYVSSDERPVLMRHARALFFCSLYEGFGLPVLEARACSTPVLTSSLSALLEHTDPGVIHVNPLHVQSIASGIASLPLRTPLAELRSWQETAARTLDTLRGAM